MRMAAFGTELKSDPTGVNIDQANRLDALTSIFASAGWLCYLATAVVFMVWAYRGHASDSVQGRHPSWWHAGAWFIPVANLLMPFLAMSDSYRGARRRRGQPEGTIAPLVIAWWVALLASRAFDLAAASAGNRLTAMTGEEETYLDLLVEVSHIMIAAGVVNALGAIPVIALVIILTRTLTAPLEQKESLSPAAEGPAAPSESGDSAR